MLGDKSVAYKEKLVRANSLEVGDVALVDGRYVPVLDVVKQPFATTEESAETLAAINVAGEGDKVSKGWDELVRVTFGVVNFNDSGEVTAVSEVHYYTEWDLVKVYV